MNKNQKNKNFISCVESRILDFNQIYTRFHIGLFSKEDALNFSNNIRRILLTSIPGFVLTEINILGAQHHLDNIHGVRENVFDIVENLKKVIFTLETSILNFCKFSEFQGFININGPGIVTAADIKISPNIKILNSSQYIASLSWDAEFILNFKIKVVDPIQEKAKQQEPKDQKFFNIENIPQPIKKINYSIHNFAQIPEFEFIIFEIITDGSIEPKEALQYSIYKMTKLFYEFSIVSF
uniref:Plastid-encoded RNA polymerase subunit alpha n=1 Tax=Prototheca cutis TaxID=575411 RepID=A0A2Z6BER1_9CHLO|nr:alpha subunit of rna polymerase [Prototheca cutis]BBD20208.1 alpha subunit of rna polymerase [Prototheca cutis]